MALTRLGTKAVENSLTNIVDQGTEGTKVASGSTGQRGSTAGQLRFNTTTGLAEYYTGSEFKAIDAPPTISSLDVTEVDSQAGGNQTIVITGSGFNAGATVTFVGNAGTDFSASTVTVDSLTQITAVAPKSSFLNAQEPYGVKVQNVSGLSATLASQINVDTAPTWTTASGSLGSVTENESASFSVSATDADSDTVSYSETGGTVLTDNGLTLNSSTGAITGTAPTVSGDTTLSFTLRATANTKTSDRAFNITILNNSLLTGLVAWYQTGNTVDSSGNNYTGTVSGSNSGSVTTVSDSGTPYGSRTVTSFPDSDGYINLPLATIITGTNARTITCWVKPSGTLDSDDYIFGFGSDTICNGATFNARCGTQRMGFMGCASDYDNNGAVVYSNGVWVRIFYTYDGTTLGAYYLDGSGNRQTSWTNVRSLNTANHTNAVAGIGRHASATSGDIVGCNSRICDFRIYNRVLTQSEMESLYYL